MKIAFGTALSVLVTLLAAGPAGAQLIDAVDYSDTFTLGQNGRANGVYGAANIGAYLLEDLHGNPTATWTPQTTYSFNDIPGSFGTGPTVLAVATGNPGAAGGVAQSGGGDFSFAYGLRTNYVVEMDAFVSPGDRTDISSWANPGDGIGATNSLSIFFRRDSIGANSLGLYNGLVETPVLDPEGNRVLIGVNDDNWHRLAVHFDQDAKRLGIYVDDSQKADLDLNTFAGGIYQNYSNGAVGAGGAGAFIDGKVLWFDNFRVGAPPGASNLNACFTRDPVSGSSPLLVSFDAGCSSFEGDPAPTFGWDFGDGGSATGEQVEHVFANGGDYQVVLTVTQGAESKTATRTVQVYDSLLVYQDDFDRPDGAIDGWTIFSGSWRLSGNAVVTGPTTGEDWIWAGSPPVSLPRTAVIEWDQFFLAPGTEPSVGRHGGLAFCVSAPTHRYDGGWNGYFVDWIDRSSDRGLRLSRVTNGAFAEIILGQGAAAPADVPLRWRLELDGVHIKLSADGVQYFDVEDTTHQGGLLGLWSWAGGQQLGFDNLTVNGEALTACFTAPRTLVGPAAGDFDGSCSSYFGGGGAIASYAWDFGDGSTGTGAQVSHSYAQPGSYDVVLTVRDDGGRTTSTGRKVDSLAPLAPFSDCFDRDPGVVDGWTAALGDWQINGDGAVEVTTAGAEAFLYAGSPPRPLGPEFAAEVDLNLLGGSHPVVGRHAAVHFYWNTGTTNRFAGDASGYAVFYIDRTEDRGLTLARFDRGVFTALNPPGGTPGFTEPPATLRIEVDGPDIRVFADGEPVIEAQDSTFRQGFFGLWVWMQNQAQFDNVRIPPSTPAVCDIASLACTVNEEGTSLAIQGTLAGADECASPSGCDCPSVEVFLDGVSQGVFPTPPGFQDDLPLPPGSCVPGSDHELKVRCVRVGLASGAEKSCSFTCPETETGGGQLPGDCTQDKLLDISDAVCLFGYLFLGSPTALPCGDGTNQDSANKTLLDHNSDALIDISDGIGLLNYLFAGGPPPAAGLQCVRITGCTESCTAP